jgi:hypothetical protein
LGDSLETPRCCSLCKWPPTFVPPVAEVGSGGRRVDPSRRPLLSFSRNKGCHRERGFGSPIKSAARSAPGSIVVGIHGNNSHDWRRGVIRIPRLGSVSDAMFAMITRYGVRRPDDTAPLFRLEQWAPFVAVSSFLDLNEPPAGFGHEHRGQELLRTLGGQHILLTFGMLTAYRSPTSLAELT